MRGTDERLPQLTQEESYQIEALLKAGHPQSGIATVLKRDKPTISREVRRNCGLRGYRPKQAQRLAPPLKMIAAGLPEVPRLQRLLEGLCRNLSRGDPPLRRQGDFSSQAELILGQKLLRRLRVY